MSNIVINTASFARPWWVFPNDEIMLECFTCWLLGSLVTTVPVGGIVGWLLYVYFYE